MYVEYAVVFHYALCGIVLIPDQSVQSSVSQCSAVDRSFLLSPLSVCTHSLSVSATGQLQHYWHLAITFTGKANSCNGVQGHAIVQRTILMYR